MVAFLTLDFYLRSIPMVVMDRTLKPDKMFVRPGSATWAALWWPLVLVVQGGFWNTFRLLSRSGIEFLMLLRYGKHCCNVGGDCKHAISCMCHRFVQVRDLLAKRSLVWESSAGRSVLLMASCTTQRGRRGLRLSRLVELEGNQGNWTVAFAFLQVVCHNSASLVSRKTLREELASFPWQEGYVARNCCYLLSSVFCAFCFTLDVFFIFSQTCAMPGVC